MKSERKREDNGGRWVEWCVVLGWHFGVGTGWPAANNEQQLWRHIKTRTNCGFSKKKEILKKERECKSGHSEIKSKADDDNIDDFQTSKWPIKHYTTLTHALSHTYSHSRIRALLTGDVIRLLSTVNRWLPFSFLLHKWVGARVWV